MEAGAVPAVTLRRGDQGDTTSMVQTIVAATENLRGVSDGPPTQDKLHENWMNEAEADKGYHSTDRC
jgi:hypothetical protein